MQTVIALLLAGGVGSRIGKDIPKQYIEVEQRMIIDRCIEQILRCERIHGIWVVADEVWQDRITDVFQGDANSDGIRGIDKSDGSRGHDKLNVSQENNKSDVLQNKNQLLGFSLPGENRALSILHGLRDIRACYEENTIVVIHDAARPLVSRELLLQCIEGCEEGYDGVMPVLPMKDTVYYSSEDGTEIDALLDRRRVWAGQAPEAYILGKYLTAYERLSDEELLALHGSTEPAVMAGMKIRMIPGDENNFKITTVADLERYQRVIQDDETADL